MNRLLLVLWLIVLLLVATEARGDDWTCEPEDGYPVIQLTMTVYRLRTTCEVALDIAVFSSHVLHDTCNHTSINL